jgi:predicted nucleic-acid-binding protein
MIGLDSNIVLRALTGDDPVQSPLASRLLSKLSVESPGVLNPIALAEIAWTLRKTYKYRKREVLACIESLLGSDAYHVVDRDAAVRALEISFEYAVEFADALIGEINRRAGCVTTMTFDIGAAQTPNFTALH